MSSRVSIIIPVYNAAPFLGAAIESALEQTSVENEIIVVDDGSTDDSLILARTYESRGVRVVSQNNRGASSARNRGLVEAKGEYIQFLDADDILAPDKLARQLSVLNDQPNSLASGRWGVFTDRTDMAVFADEPTYGNAQPVDWLVQAWTSGGMMHPGAWLAPRALLDKAGPWNEALSLDDDGEYFARVVLASGGVVHVPEAVVYYRRHSGPHLSGSRGERAWKSALLSCELKESALLAIENSPRTRRACANSFCRYAWDHYPEGGPYARRAIAHWHQLDSTVVPPGGGRREALIARWLGWRLARRLKKRLFGNTSRSG